MSAERFEFSKENSHTLKYGCQYPIRNHLRCFCKTGRKAEFSGKPYSNHAEKGTDITACLSYKAGFMKPQHADAGKRHCLFDLIPFRYQPVSVPAPWFFPGHRRPL